MYFSIKTSSLPKDFRASFFAKGNISFSSFTELAILIPFPPPPAEAFIIIGNPIFFDSRIAESIFLIEKFVPGIKGTLKSKTAFFADNLSPITLIEFESGPTNIRPSLITLFANSAFSDRNP